jgi:hypothetical protein
LRLDLVHAFGLQRRSLFARLLHFQEHSAAMLEAEKVGNSRELERPAVDFHRPPATLFG